MFDAAGTPLAVVKQLDPASAQPAAARRHDGFAGCARCRSRRSRWQCRLRWASRSSQHNRSHGISEAEGIAALERLFTTSAPAVLVSTSLRPADLSRQAQAASHRAQTGTTAMYARPRLESEFEAPRDELERSLAEAWGRLLGVQGIGIRDSFFELGGHSLIAVRLFNEIADRHRIDLPMSALIQHPDIAGLAERIRGSLPEAGAQPPKAAKHVSPMARSCTRCPSSPVRSETVHRSSSSPACSATC